MNKTTYQIVAAISFLFALLLIDSPVWVISFVALAIMGVATFKGRLWE